ncbi:hypothetical protein B0O99DRAFT_683122 [Bisporella sp. PMI_857]|nr:hypothetical protein B0O99DRAFT_683122 [Bisporella sp. PMI_857]
MAHSEDEASGPQEVITPENVDLDPLANTTVEVLKNDVENGVSSEQPPSPTLDPKTETPAFTARRYQLEMLGESLKKNIIVAMDTGSGICKFPEHIESRTD